MSVRHMEGNMSVNLVGYRVCKEEKKTSDVVLVFVSQDGIFDIMRNIYRNIVLPRFLT